MDLESARVALANGRPVEAMHSLEMALEKEPRNFEANLLLGSMLKEHSESQGAALDHLKMAHEIRPWNPEALLKLFDLYMDTRNDRMAQELISEADKAGKEHWKDFLETLRDCKQLKDRAQKEELATKLNWKPNIELGNHLVQKFCIPIHE